MTLGEHTTNTSLGKRLTRTGLAALLLTSPLAACSNQRKTPTICESPRATSPLFPADPTATKDRATWTKGIAIHTNLTPDVEGVVVGFRGQSEGTWHDSLPVSPDAAQTMAVFLGNGAVSFSVFVTVNEGSGACTGRPPVTFSQPQPIETLTGATLPQW